jgi:hypothetical protein
MNAKFYEFWGQSFLNIAKGQRQMEEFKRWFREGFSGSDSLSVLFRQIYGLDDAGKDDAEYLKFYEKAVHSFQQCFRDHLRLFDVVPREELDASVKECESLRQKVSELERTIAHLKAALGDQGVESAQTVRDLQNIIGKQTDQFQELVKAMGEAFAKRPKSK